MLVRGDAFLLASCRPDEWEETVDDGSTTTAGVACDEFLLVEEDEEDDDEEDGEYFWAERALFVATGGEGRCG